MIQASGVAAHTQKLKVNKGDGEVLSACDAMGGRRHGSQGHCV